VTVVVTNSTVVRRLSVLLQQSAAAAEPHHCHQFYVLHDPYHPTWEVSPPDQHSINKFITTMQERERDLLDRDLDFTSRMVFDGGTGGHVPLTRLRRPPHWN